MDYRPRIVDEELDELLPGLPAIALEGPKAVGKTATALRRARTVHRLDDPAQQEIIAAEPDRMISGPRPVLIDEWQRFPSSWDTVRRAVDADRTPGQFLLTGSALPIDAPTHSGAGRISTVRMRPLSLAERGIETPTVSLRALLSGERDALDGNTAVSLTDYVQEIVRSGFPAIRELTGRALRTDLDSYIERIATRDIEDNGRSTRNAGALRRWMAAYGAATATTASYEKIRDAATSGEDQKPAKTTAIPFRATLERLWIIDDVPAWVPSRNHIRRLSSASRHHLADPALAARLLGADSESLLAGATLGPAVQRDGTLLGALFESLVTQSIRVYAQSNEARTEHLRTAGGEHEVDLIVERGDGKVVAFEVKVGRTVNGDDVRHLAWLANLLGAELLDSVVITAGPAAYRRSDGIGVVPAALLGP
jgi:predicted AAA+ superfamily ATPase